MIYSASGVLADKRFGAHSCFLKRQLLWCAIGLVALLVVARCELVTLRRWAGPGLLLGLPGPVLVLLPPIGGAGKGPRGWLRVRAPTLRPAEGGKLGSGL